MEPSLRDGQEVQIRHALALPGDIVAVAEKSRARVHRYLGPIPDIKGGRLQWRLLTCADDTSHCDPLAEMTRLIGVVETPITARERLGAARRYAVAVSQNVQRKIALRRSRRFG